MALTAKSLLQYQTQKGNCNKGSASEIRRRRILQAHSASLHFFDATILKVVLNPSLWQVEGSGLEQNSKKVLWKQWADHGEGNYAVLEVPLSGWVKPSHKERENKFDFSEWFDGHDCVPPVKSKNCDLINCTVSCCFFMFLLVLLLHGVLYLLYVKHLLNEPCGHITSRRMIWCGVVLWLHSWHSVRVCCWTGLRFSSFTLHLFNESVWKSPSPQEGMKFLVTCLGVELVRSE